VRPIVIDDADSIIRTFQLSLGGETSNAENAPETKETPEVVAGSVEEKSDEARDKALWGKEGDAEAEVTQLEPEVKAQPEIEAVVEVPAEAASEVPAAENAPAEPSQATIAEETGAEPLKEEPPVTDVPIKTKLETTAETTRRNNRRSSG
jgi:hypothetical protein